MVDYLKEWTAAAGPNNFSKTPSNATLSVYEPGKEGNTLTVVEISQPVIEGRDLVYRYKVLEGKVPATGGATSLFIDWIGPGGGVGPGFHGVGVGARGVGFRGTGEDDGIDTRRQNGKQAAVRRQQRLLPSLVDALGKFHN